jgi:hypothetical protein
MTEALSGNVKLTVGALCRDSGFVGLTITALYHAIVLATNTERYVVLAAPREAALLFAVFVVAAGCQQYSQCWLVLRTRAVEYARVVTFASLVLAAIRHSVFREEGAAYGFYQFPWIAAAVTIAGFVLVSIGPSPGAGMHTDEHSQQGEV